MSLDRKRKTDSFISTGQIKFTRKEQITKWNNSETAKESSKPRQSSKIKFPSGVCFHAACYENDTEDALFLLKNGADVNSCNNDHMTPLHQACIDDNIEIIEFLLNNGCDVNAQDIEGWTPLHAAASCGYFDVVELLLSRGSDPSITNNDNELAIDLSDDDKTEEVLRNALTDKAVNVDVARDAEHQLMLEDATRWQRIGCPADFGDRIDSTTKASPLHVAAAKNYTDVLEVLLKCRGINLDARDRDGWTALHAAAHWGHRDAARLLCEAGCEVDATSKRGETPLDVTNPDILVVMRQLKEKFGVKLRRREMLHPQLRDKESTGVARRTSVIRHSMVEKKATRMQKELSPMGFLMESMVLRKTLSGVFPFEKKQAAAVSNPDEQTSRVSQYRQKMLSLFEAVETPDTPSDCSSTSGKGTGFLFGDRLATSSTSRDSRGSRGTIGEPSDAAPKTLDSRGGIPTIEVSSAEPPAPGTELVGDLREVTIGGPEETVGGPDVTTGGPEVTIGGPEVTIGGPEVTTGGPEVTVGGPEVTTGGPEVTVGGPEVTTGGPEVTIGGPEVTVGGPEVTIGGPEVTVGGPEVTIGGPEVTTGGPDVTTGGPEVTIGGPEVTIGGPEENTCPQDEPHSQESSEVEETTSLDDLDDDIPEISSSSPSVSLSSGGLRIASTSSADVGRTSSLFEEAPESDASPVSSTQPELSRNKGNLETVFESGTASASSRSPSDDADNSPVLRRAQTSRPGRPHSAVPPPISPKPSKDRRARSTVNEVVVRTSGLMTPVLSSQSEAQRMSKSRQALSSRRSTQSEVYDDSVFEDLSKSESGDAVDYKAISQQLQEEVDALVDKVAALTAELDVQTKLNDQQSKADEYQARIKELESENSALKHEKELDKLRVENHRLKEENASLIRVISKMSLRNNDPDVKRSNNNKDSNSASLKYSGRTSPVHVVTRL